MTHPVLVVCAKEIVDNVRDRRSLLSALIYPLLGPLVFALLLHVLGGVVGPQGSRAELRLPVAGAEHAPRLLAWLKGQGVRVMRPPAEIEDSVRAGEWLVVLVLPPDFDRVLAAGGSASVTVVSDASSVAGELMVGKLADLLKTYGRDLSGTRLDARGIDRTLLEPVRIDNVIAVQRRNVFDTFLFMVPPFILFTVFIGGVYLAIDTTSGERERGSLEPLMANPVPRWQFMFGKFLAAYVFTLVALLVQLAAFSLVLETVGAGLFSPGSHFGPATVATFVVVCLPLMAFTVAVQIIIAALTRSFKEAQTWLGLLPLLPAAPGLAMVFAPVRAGLLTMLPPVFSQTVVLGQIVRGEPVSLGLALLSAGATLVAAALLLRFAAHLFEREEMIFG